jgi:DNA-cytosine methyltransferase
MAAEGPIRYLSLFSGIGGDALAMRELRANSFECVGFAEVNPDAVAVYAHHHPAHLNLGDVTQITEAMLAPLRPIHLVVGGSPCQGFSQAGKRLGLDDPRSGLFVHFARLLRESGAQYVLLENVASMKNAHRDAITETLRAILPEVRVTYINSARLTAQNRRRLYWTNFPVDEPEDAHITLATVVQNMGGVPPAKPIIRHQCNMLEVAQRAGAPAAPFTFMMRRKTDYVRVPGRNAKVRDFEHLPRTDSKSNVCSCSAVWSSLVYDGSTVRQLTIRECETLQGFPPGYTGVTDASEHRRLKLVGNAFTVPVFAHLFSCLLRHAVQ